MVNFLQERHDTIENVRRLIDVAKAEMDEFIKQLRILANQAHNYACDDFKSMNIDRMED